MYTNKFRGSGRGIGDILQESSTISFDTDRGMFFNPQTNTDYGPTAPIGGWPLSWYSDSKTNEIKVLNQPGAIQTDKATILSQLASQSMLTPEMAVANTAAKVAANTAMITNANNASSVVATSAFDLSSLTSNLPNFLKNSDGTPNWTYIGIGALGVWFAFKKFL